MKKYAVTVEVVMAGTIYVKAESAEEAKHIAYGKAGYYEAKDLRKFENLTREVVDVEAVDE